MSSKSVTSAKDNVQQVKPTAYLARGSNKVINYAHKTFCN